jgi:hypothetical protein
MASLLMLGTIMGDCFPDVHHSCLTDHERNVRLLEILFATLAVNIAFVFLVSRVRASDDDQNSN